MGVGGRKVGKWRNDKLALRSLPQVRGSHPSPIHASLVPPGQPVGHWSGHHFPVWVRAEERWAFWERSLSGHMAFQLVTILRREEVQEGAKSSRTVESRGWCGIRGGLGQELVPAPTCSGSREYLYVCTYGTGWWCIESQFLSVKFPVCKSTPRSTAM